MDANIKHQGWLLQLFSNFFLPHLRGSCYNHLMSKDFKREWAQEAARKKLRDMRGSLSDVRIGKLLGFSGTYIGNVLKEPDPDADPPITPKPVSLRLWNALIEKADFRPQEPQTEKGSEPSARLTVALETLAAVIREMNAKLDRIESRLK